MPALIADAVYLRLVPVDDVGAEDAEVRMYYARLSGLLVRRMA